MTKELFLIEMKLAGSNEWVIWGDDDKYDPPPVYFDGEIQAKSKVQWLNEVSTTAQFRVVKFVRFWV